jgi:hypothetical protein
LTDAEVRREDARVSFNDLPLLISLLFGAGQCVFGVVVLWYGVRAGRWRRTGIFLLMVLGVWALWSGAAELLVSGMVVAARGHTVPTQAQFARVRAWADGGLIAVSAGLLIPLALFALWKRSQRASTGTSDHVEREG